MPLGPPCPRGRCKQGFMKKHHVLRGFFELCTEPHFKLSAYRPH